MAYSYTSGIYLHLEGTDSEVSSIQKQRELTWVKDLEALRYLNCSGVPYYIYASSLDLSGVINHMDIVNQYGTGLWEDYGDFIKPLRSKSTYVEDFMVVGEVLDPSLIDKGLYDSKIALTGSSAFAPATLTTFYSTGDILALSRGAYYNPTGTFLRSEATSRAISYEQKVSTSSSYHMFRTINNSNASTSGNAISWDNQVLINEEQTILNYEGLNQGYFKIQRPDDADSLVYEAGRLSLGTNRTSSERLEVSGALTLEGGSESDVNGTVRFQDGWFEFRESGVWKTLGGGSTDTNTTYTGVLPIHISGVLGDDLGVKLLYTDEFSVNAQGQLSIDYNNFMYYDSKSVTIEAPISGDCVTLFYTDEAMTVQSVHGTLCQSGNVYWNIRHDGDHRSSTGTLLTASPNQVYWDGTGTNLGSHVWSGWSDATISGNSWVWLEIPQNTSYDDEETPLTFHLTVNYRKD